MNLCNALLGGAVLAFHRAWASIVVYYMYRERKSFRCTCNWHYCRWCMTDIEKGIVLEKVLGREYAKR